MTTKRTLALLLALLMAGSAVSCGSGEQGNTDTTANNGGETTEAPVGETSGVPAEVDYEDATVRILNGCYAEYLEKQQVYLDVQETTGDSLNDAIYERNLAVMENVGVKLEFDNMDLYNKYATVRNTVMAGDDTWDFIIGMQYRVTQLTPEGLFADLIDAPYIDIEKPWWSTQFIENLNIGEEHRYLLSGDYSIGHLNQASAMFYNKDLYKDFYQDPDEVYDFVIDGKWTLDKLYEISSGVAKDVNGDTKIDSEHDVFGFGQRSTAFTHQHICFDAGLTLTEYANGTYSIKGVTNKNTQVIEKINRLIFENPGYAEIPAGFRGNVDDALSETLANDQVMFIPGLLSYADLLREMESDYGVIPYPKGDENDDYRALVHNQAFTFAVPITTKEFDRACAVVEEMAFLGYRDMLPTYYEEVLKQKYMRDDQDSAMKCIDIIHDNLYTELVFTYASFVTYMSPVLKASVGTGSLASNDAANITKANEQLKTLLEFFEQ